MICAGDELGRTQQRQQQRLLPGQRDSAGSTGTSVDERAARVHPRAGRAARASTRCSAAGGSSPAGRSPGRTARRSRHRVARAPTAGQMTEEDWDDRFGQAARACSSTARRITEPRLARRAASSTTRSCCCFNAHYEPIDVRRSRGRTTASEWERACSTPATRARPDGRARATTAGGTARRAGPVPRRARPDGLSVTAATSRPATYRLQVRPRLRLRRRARRSPATCTTSASATSTRRRCCSRDARLAARLRRRRPPRASTRSSAARRACGAWPPRCARTGSASSSTSCPTTWRCPSRQLNPAWWDVLAHGRDSRVRATGSTSTGTAGPHRLLPVLRRRRVRRWRAVEVDGDELRYYEHRFPIAPGTGDGTPQQVHDRQHYRLVDWRRGNERAQLPPVLRRRHAGRAARRGPGASSTRPTPRSCAGSATGVVDGLRVDHPDGLRRPRRLPRRGCASAHRTALAGGREDPGARRARCRRTGRSTARPATTRSATSAGCSSTRPGAPGAGRPLTAADRRPAHDATKLERATTAAVPGAELRRGSTPLGAGRRPARRLRRRSRAAAQLPRVPHLPARRPPADLDARRSRETEHAAGPTSPTPLDGLEPPAAPTRPTSCACGSSSSPAPSWPRASRTPRSTAGTGSSP